MADSVDRADLDESADGSTIALAVGETRLLVLGERPTTGFSWHATTSNSAVVVVTATAFRARSLTPGGGGERVFTISALTAGSSTVTWAHQRGSGASGVADRRIALTFDVR